MIARNFSRTLLRAAPLANTSTVAARASIRPATIVSRFAPLSQSVTRAFSATPFPRGQGESDAELSAKLAQELSYEQENSNLFVGDSPTNEPGFVTEFKQGGVWKIDDKPGLDEVALEREFGNEHIKIIFSVGGLDTTGPLPEGEEDGAEMEASPDQPETADFPVRISATFTKPSEGALMLDAFVQDGEINVDNIAYYKDKNMATRIDAEADFERRGIYLGPQFETLDDALQSQFHQYLSERGFDANLALFIPNYAEYKEQREYCAWLGNVRNFVDA
ncbi:probable Mrb1 - Mitochondrial p32 Family Protein [Ustilago trichophora]|uniref:Probable Mrb1 - Mitochondrial p32 Family Protein n=1 Tax=Ustilago trichophora TaxID=86804 RepID=A0A5C3EM93_9BASI|nr:probable Mrb1 - Mitochondrial p32 Family Protein [Ustilago trichophora]